MSNQPQTPDRRPVIYTAIGILIVAIAAVLFWPRPQERGPDALVLTPNDLPSPEVAADETQPIQTPLKATDQTVEAATPPGDAFPVRDAQLNENTVVEAKPDPKPIAPKPTPTVTPPQAKTQPKPAAAKPAVAKPVITSAKGPGDQGAYLLNVGSFGDRANAAALVAKLSAQGIQARMSSAAGQHGTVYRVQIGYFEGHSVAEAYGREVKRQAGVDFWVGQR